LIALIPSGSKYHIAAPLVSIPAPISHNCKQITGGTRLGGTADSRTKQNLVQSAGALGWRWQALPGEKRAFKCLKHTLLNEHPPIQLHDVVAILPTTELDRLSEAKEQLELYEDRIDADRSRLAYPKERFDDAGLDSGGRVQAGEDLLKTMNRVQQTLEESCNRLRGPG
jgi:hypothetical protein